MHKVEQPLEETLSQVHVSNGVDALLEVHASWELAVVRAPVVLNAFEMPLVDKHHYSLAVNVVDLGKEVLISFVHEYLLYLREEDVSALDIPVNEVLVKAGLREGLRTGHSNLLSVAKELLGVWGLSVHHAFQEVVGHVHSCLVIKAISCDCVHLFSKELKLCSHLLGGLASILDLKAGEPEPEFEAEAEVPLEGLPV